MRQKVEDMLVKDVSVKDITLDECKHYWKIESSNDPISIGVCKYCGAEKEFLNSLPDYTVIRRNSRVLEGPGLPESEVDGEKDDSEFEKNKAALPV